MGGDHQPAEGLEMDWRGRSMFNRSLYRVIKGAKFKLFLHAHLMKDGAGKRERMVLYILIVWGSLDTLGTHIYVKT